MRPLMVGPLGGVVTGQSVAFKEACAALPGAVVVDAAFCSWRRALTYPWRLLNGFFASRGNVYFTSSRSTIGFYFRDLPVFFLSRIFERSLLNHLHGNDFVEFRNSSSAVTRWLVDWCYRGVEVSCAPSAKILEQYAPYGTMHLQVVPNFFDPEIQLFLGVDTEADDRLEIIYLSNLIYSKGFTIAVDACRILEQRGIPVHLTLCGSPLGDRTMSADQIRGYVAGLEGDPMITVAGPVFGEMKYRLLSRASVFMLPTTYPTEAVPISIIEALAAGCHVISTAHGAIPELVVGFDAALMAARAEDFADAVQRYFSREDKAEGAARNRALAATMYSAAAYRANICRLLARRRACDSEHGA